MSRNAAGFFLPPISLDRRSAMPLYQQLYHSIRQGVLRGTLRKGLRLPSSRYLAAELRVSRNIVLIAFEQLLAEGYLQSLKGAGTFVSHTLPEEVLQVQSLRRHEKRVLSARGSAMHSLAQLTPALPLRVRYAPFRCGMPALEHLPLELWGRLLFRHCKRASPEVGINGDPMGYRRLRQAIASYVGVARAVRCTADQVIIANGSQQAIDLAARVLADPGDQAAVEDPCYAGARSALQAAGLKLLPINVEEDGVCVQKLPTNTGATKIVYVTPSHQFPLGVVLSLAKRLQLLDWAHRQGAWILEDDFDSEYRYESKPIPALQGLDQNGRVIYMGTFSKVLFPALRMGYMIVPDDLVDAFVSARWISDRASPQIEQAALADFIEEGHLATHIRRMRTLYMERRSAMMTIIRHESADVLECADADAGMHMVGWLPRGLQDIVVAKQAAEAGIHTLPLSSFRLRPLSRGGLLLGYAAFSPRSITKAMRELGMVIRNCIPNNGSRVQSVAKRVVARG
jgi:GntR family transcriptional regulator / MocR family aminotransferase